MANESILVVDDEEDIANLLVYNLSKNGYRARAVYSGEEALAAIESELPNLIVLDLMLPGIDGLEVCRLLKQNGRTAKIPIIMATAKSEELDEILGLELGAADYISKPFSVRVLLARIKVCLRRMASEEQPIEEEEQVGLYVDENCCDVMIDGKRSNLTITEYRIFSFLYKHQGRVYTREQIISSLHEDEYVITVRAVDVQIAGLRKKLGEYGKYIETIRGVGYRFVGK